MPAATESFQSQPLPMTPEEVTSRGWDAVDVIFVTGDAYVDHPSFAMALLGRLLQSEGYRVALHYLRDRAGHETDFLVTLNRKPWFAVEAKLSSSRIDPSLIYFRDRLAIPWTYQVTLNGDRDYLKDGVRCLPAARFLASLV